MIASVNQEMIFNALVFRFIQFRYSRITFHASRSRIAPSPSHSARLALFAGDEAPRPIPAPLDPIGHSPGAFLND